MWVPAPCRAAPARRALHMPGKQMRALQAYNAEKVNKIIENMVTALFMEQPQDPTDFMIKWLLESRVSNPGEKGELLERLALKARSLEVDALEADHGARAQETQRTPETGSRIKSSLEQRVTPRPRRE